MAKISRKIIGNIETADKAIKKISKVSKNWTPEDIKKFGEVNKLLSLSNASEDERFVLAEKLSGRDYIAFAQKLGIPVENEERSGVNINDEVINGSIRANGKADFNTEDMISLIETLAHAQYHIRCINKAEPFWNLLMKDKKIITDMRQANPEHKLDNRTSFEKSLSMLGVDISDIEKLLSKVDFEKQGFEDSTNSKLKDVEKLGRQYESAKIANAINERLLGPDPQAFTKDKLNDINVINFLCKDGESRDNLFERVEDYVKDLEQVLPKPDNGASGEQKTAYGLIVREVIRACVNEGAFSFDNKEERFNAFARALASEKVSEKIFEHRIYLFSEDQLKRFYPEQTFEGQAITAVKSSPVLFGHDGEILFVDDLYAGQERPQWAKDQMSNQEVLNQIKNRHTYCNESGKDIARDINFADLKPEDLKFCNPLACYAAEISANLRGERLEKEAKEAKSRQLAKKKTQNANYYVGLSFYAEALNEAKKLIQLAKAQAYSENKSQSNGKVENKTEQETESQTDSIINSENQKTDIPSKEETPKEENSREEDKAQEGDNSFGSQEDEDKKPSHDREEPELSNDGSAEQQ